MKRACTTNTNRYEQNKTGLPLLSPSGLIRPLKINSVWLKKMALIVSALFTLNSYMQAQPFSGGTGTSTDPFQISTVVQLDSVHNYLDANFILMNDLNFAGSAYDSTSTTGGWVPIGGSSNNYTGSFNGAGHTISNLYINRADYTGLFGYTNGAEIDSLGLLNCNISGYTRVGGLVGEGDYSTLANCYATGKVSGLQWVGGLMGLGHYSPMTNCYTAVQVSGSNNLGGLMGFANYSSPLTNCYATGNVTGNNTCGGLVGYNSYFSPLVNCYNTGNIYATNGVVGGLVGYNLSSLTDCNATGQVSGGNIVGGLVGYNSPQTYPFLKNCYATGQVSGNDYVGGLVGDNADTLTNCYATGKVSGNKNVGGLAGNNIRPMTNCYASGQVSGISSSVGGLVGSSSSTLTDCNASGQVSGKEYVGGLTGSNSGSLTNCYVTGNVSGEKYVGGLAGSNSGTLTNCYNAVKVSGSYWYVGGMVGSNSGTLSLCYALGNVSGEWYVGGLVGENISTVVKCYAAGQVSGDGRVGGLAGATLGFSAVTNCYATGQVSGGRGSAGGLVGENWITLTNCYATGKVLGCSFTGGLVGDNYPNTLTNCYYNTETSGQSSGIGYEYHHAVVTGLTTAEMKQQSSFTGFDFNTVWSITNGTTFARLQANYNVPVILHTIPAGIKKNILYTDTIQVVPMDNNNITITLEASPAGMQLQDSIITWTPDSSGVYTIAIKASDANAKFSTYIAKIAVEPQGEGTGAYPYQITTIGELSTVRQLTDAYFVLMNDLDFTGSTFDSINSTEGWEPIGNFTGSFKGAGHTISNLYINSSSADYMGLFSYTNGAEIDSLGLLNCNISGDVNVGGLAGHTDSSTVTNCYATGNVSGTEYVGGLMGEYDYSSLANCYTTAKVSGKWEVGGLAGITFYSSTLNCYATGKVSGSVTVGGLLAYNENSSITNCYATGQVSGDTYVGGLVAYNSSSTLTNCYYNNETSGQSSGIGYDDNHQTVTGLTTVKMKQQSNFTGFNFSTVWAIRADSTYPALRTLNNAPFAFSDTITGVGASVSYSRFLPNDYDYETLQTALVVSIQSLPSGSYSNNAVYLPDTAQSGDEYIVYYRVGEVLANDTLWGNVARSVLIATTNTAPVLTAVRDTTTNEDEAITLTMSSVTATDAEGDVLSIIVYNGTNYSVSGTTVLPAAGYYGTLSVPVSVTDGRDTSNILTMSITVIANPVYTITASAGTGGSISPSGAVNVEEGYNQSFTITANNGYHIADVLVDGSSVGAVSSYTFSNVIAGHTIAASFAVTTYTITASAGNNGSINPSGAVSVEEGNSQSFTITANNDYHIADVLVDGSSVGAVSSYTFINVTANHTITASFDTNTVGLPKETTNCISVSPNPFINTLTISTDYWGDGYYTLVSIIGNEIGSGPLTDKVTELNLTGLRSGVYLLQFKVNEHVQNIRIVKQ